MLKSNVFVSLRLLTIGLCLFGSSLVAKATDLTLSNINYDAGLFKIAIPRIDIRGTSLSENDIRSILDGSAPGRATDNIARLNASSVIIPELVMDQSVGSGGSQRLVYRDIRLTDIVSGVIGRMVSSGMRGEMVDPAVGKMPFTIGEMSAEAVDLPLSARVLTGAVPDPSNVAMSSLYKTVSYKDYVITLPANMGSISIANVVGREARARPGKEPLITTIRSVMQMAEAQQATGPNKGNPSAADLALIARMIGFLDNFEYGVTDAEGFKGEFATGSEKGSFSIARMRFSDQPEHGGFAMSDFRFEAGPAKVSLAEFEMRDFGYRDSLRALSQIMERGDLNALMTEYTKLIPKLGTIRISGFNLEAPETLRPNRRNPPETIRVSLKNMELGFGQQIDGIPTALRFGGEEFAGRLLESSRDKTVRDLIAAGYRDINVSWLADLAWVKDSEQFNIKALNLSGKDMAALAIAGQLGNVSKEAFSTDTALAQVAWLSATAQRVTMTFENFGGVEKIIAREADKAKKTPEALRREWGTIAAIGLPAVLGDSDGAKAITAAVSRFLARPGKLGLDLQSRSASGIGVADAVQAMGSPQALFDKIDVRAQAE